MAVTPFPPMVMVENGQVEGYLPAHMREVAREAGFGISFTSLPVRRYVHSLADGTHHVMWGVRTYTEFANRVNSSADPIAIVPLNAYHLGETPPLRDQSDLRGKSVVTITGYSYDDLGAYIRDPGNGIQAYDIPDHTAAIRFLLAGRADYLLNYEPAFKSHANCIAGTDQIQASRIGAVPFHLVTSKTRDPSGELLDRLWQAHETVSARPDYRANIAGTGYVIP